MTEHKHHHPDAPKEDPLRRSFLIRAMAVLMGALCALFPVIPGLGFFLDPDKCQPFLVDGGDVFWLEFHRPVSPALAIQAIEKTREEAIGATGA